MEKPAIQSKKWTMGAFGIIAVMISGAAAAMAGAAGLAVLPYVVGGIVTLAGGSIVTQGFNDQKKELPKDCPPAIK
jgi:uncharacterized membrane protein HdeD (DUF308 family)